MASPKSRDHYLVSRNGRWHYVRRVPEAVSDHDTRTFSKISLRTTSVEVARVRRDAMAEADDLYWASLLKLAEGATVSPARDSALADYHAAQSYAFERGTGLSAAIHERKPHRGDREAGQSRKGAQLDRENAQLRKLVAELSLEKAVLTDALLKLLPSQR